MTKKLFIIIAILVFGAISINVFSQLPPPPPPPPGGGGSSGPVTPIDGGLITILVGAGVSYFIAKKRKSKNQEEAN